MLFEAQIISTDGAMFALSWGLSGEMSRWQIRLDAFAEPRDGRGMQAAPIATRPLLALVARKLALGIYTVVFEKRPQSLIIAI